MIHLSMALALAGSGDHEVTLGTTLAGHTAPRQIAGGAGLGLAWRVHLSERLDAGIALDGLVFSVPALGTTAGLGLRAAERGLWQARVGVEAGALWGRITVLSPEHPKPPGAPPVGLRLVVRPAVLDLGDSVVSLGELAYGRPLEDPLHGHAFRATVIAVGRRW